MVALERLCAHIGLYLHPLLKALGCQTFGLLLVTVGQCLDFARQGNYGSGCLLSIIVPVRRAYFPKKMRSTLERL